MISGKLVRNTGALFVRQMLVLSINLYTIRALLGALGVHDFALLNVITNVVMLGSFLPDAMGTIIQRYVAFAIGRGDSAALKQVHDASLIVSVVASLLIVLVLETVGLWFVWHRLVVDPDKLDTAKVLFQLMILSFAISNVTAFFSSIVTAHEDMHVFAIFSLGDAFVRLGAVLAIGFLAADRLEVYGVLQCLGVGAILVAYVVFCRRRYAVCRSGRIRFEASTLQGMLGFAGWTIFGQLSTISRNQAVTILINQTFSPATVAARALASSVSTQVLNFSTNFSASLHPPVIKAHAAGETEQMFALIFAGSKITFFLVWLATLPIMVAMPGILTFWLGSYPAETASFARLALVENAITAISFPLMTAVRATGNMRTYELSLGSLQFLVLLFSWLLVRAGYPAYSVYVVAIAINLVMFAVRLAITVRQTRLPCGIYLRRVVLPVLLVVATSSGLGAAALALAPWVQELRPFPASVALLGVIFLLTVGLVYLLGLTRGERQSMQAMVLRRLPRMGGRS